MSTQDTCKCSATFKRIDFRQFSLTLTRLGYFIELTVNKFNDWRTTVWLGSAYLHNKINYK